MSYRSKDESYGAHVTFPEQNMDENGCLVVEYDENDRFRGCIFDWLGRSFGYSYAYKYSADFSIVWMVLPNSVKIIVLHLSGRRGVRWDVKRRTSCRGWILFRICIESFLRLVQGLRLTSQGVV